MEKRIISYLLVVLLIISQVFGVFAQTSLAKELDGAKNATLEEKTENGNIDDLGREDLDKEEVSLPDHIDTSEEVDLDLEENLDLEEANENITQEDQAEEDQESQGVTKDEAELDKEEGEEPSPSNDLNLEEGGLDLKVEGATEPQAPVKTQLVNDLEVDLIEGQSPVPVLLQIMEMEAQARKLNGNLEKNDRSIYLNGEEFEGSSLKIDLDQLNKLAIKLDWELSQANEIKVGDYLELDLGLDPKIGKHLTGKLLNQGDKIDLKSKLDNSKIVEMAISNSIVEKAGHYYLRIDFVKIQKDPSAKIEGNVKGEFKLDLNFMKSIVMTSKEKSFTINLGVNKNFTFEVDLPGEAYASMEKKGEQRGQEIYWTVDLEVHANPEFIKIEDQLPQGLALSARGITIKVDGKELGTRSSFPINIKNENYKNISLGYSTNVESNQTGSYTNHAQASLGGRTVRDSATVDYEKIDQDLLEKQGYLDYDREKDKYFIKWTIFINGEDRYLSNVILEDKIEPGLSLDKDSIKLYKGEEEALNNDNRYFESNGSVLKWDFYPLNSNYKLEYRTYIDKYSEEDDPYKNIVTMKERYGSEKLGSSTAIVKPGIKNTFNKSAIIDYRTNTIRWFIDIELKNDGIETIELEDSFNRDMEIVDKQIKVGKDDKRLETEKLLSDLKIDGKKGFSCTIKNDSKPHRYTIEYSTKFDSTDLRSRLDYKNTAKFNLNKNKDEFERQATAILNKSIMEGKKFAEIATNKDIEWKILVNPLARKMESFRLEDKIGPGQHINLDSLQVQLLKAKSGIDLSKMEDRQRESNTMNFTTRDNRDLEEWKDFFSIEGGLVKGTHYELGFIDDSSDKFKLEFKPKEINAPYLISYKASLDQSSGEKLYTNEAKIYEVQINEDLENRKEDYSLEGKKAYSSKSLIDKKLLFTPGKELLIEEGTVLDWQVVINESEKQLENLTFTDTISQGHEYVPGSFKVYDSKQATEQATEPIIKEGVMTFKLGNLSKKKVIKYQTRVVASKQDISNTAKLSGNNIKTIIDKSIDLTIGLSYSFNGEGELSESIDWTEIEQPVKKPWTEIEQPIKKPWTEIEQPVKKPWTEIEQPVKKPWTEIEQPIKKPWTEIEQPIKKPWTEIEQPIKKPWTEIEQPIKKPWTEIEQPVKKPWTEIEQPIKKPWTEIEQPVKKPWTEIEQPIKKPWTEIKPPIGKPEDPKEEIPWTPLEPSQEVKPWTPLEPSIKTEENPKEEKDRPSRPSRPSRPDRDKSNKEREEEIEETIYHEMSKEPEEILDKNMEQPEASPLEEIEEEIREEIFHMFHEEEENKLAREEASQKARPTRQAKGKRTLPKTGSGHGPIIGLGFISILMGIFLLRKKKN